MNQNLEKFKTIARHIGIAHLLRVAYRDPLHRLRTMIRDGGPVEQRRTEAGRKEMEKHALNIVVDSSSYSSSSEVHLLTGSKFWYQTLFCLVSMQQQSLKLRIVPVLYDDGTLSKDIIDCIYRIIPYSKIVSYKEIEDTLNSFIPYNKYPSIRNRRVHYPHLRKITDIHVGTTGWKLVMDSDMLFFKPPNIVLDWLVNPAAPLHMIDVEQSYGYSPKLLSELAGGPVPPLVNVGMLGIQSESIDWDKMEYWCREMISREGSSYFQEQALSALLVSDKDTIKTPSSEYIVLPSLKEGKNPSAIMHHYVAESKRSYFQYSWRIVCNRM